MTGRLVGAVALVVAAATLGGCSVGDKEALAKQLGRAAGRAYASGTASATLRIAVIPIAVKGVTLPGPPRIPPATAEAIPASLDFTHSRAAVGGNAADPASAVLLFDGFVVLQRRPTSTSAGGSPLARLGPATNLTVLTASAVAAAPSASATGPTRRPWVRFDYSSLPRRGGDRIAGNFAINPDVAVGFLAGALSGSVRRLGPETINGETTTHFRFNVGRDKAERGLPEAARKTLDKMFRANAVAGIVYHAEAWLGPDGRPRRVSIDFPQRLTKRDRATLRVRLDVGDYGKPLSISLPAARDVAKATDLGQLVRSSGGPESDARVQVLQP